MTLPVDHWLDLHCFGLDWIGLDWTNCLAWIGYLGRSLGGVTGKLSLYYLYIA